MTTRRGGSTVSVRQFDWHKRYHHRIMAHPGYQALSFERRGIYNHLYDMAAVANDDGAVRVGAGPRFSRRKLVEFLAASQASPQGKHPDEFMAWARAAVDCLVQADLLRTDGDGVVWVLNYADEQAAISPAGLRKRAQREREEQARGAGGGHDPSTEDEGGDAGLGWDGSRPRRLVPTRPGPSALPPSTSDETFDAGFDASPRVGQSRDGHAQSQNQSQNHKGTYVPRRSESESEQHDRRFANADAPARSDVPLSGGRAEGPGREDLYAMNPIDAACRVTGEHGLYMANTARKVQRELGDPVLWSIIGEVADARRDGLIRKRRPDGTITGGPLFNSIAERYRQRAAARAACEGMKSPIGFADGEERAG